MKKYFLSLIIFTLMFVIFIIAGEYFWIKDMKILATIFISLSIIAIFGQLISIFAIGKRK